MTVPAQLVLALHVVASAAAVVAYGFDKARARAGGRRVRESTLHLLALAGGWPGALLAARLFRHKTRDLPFRVVTAAILLLHLLGWLLAWRAGWVP